MSNYFEYQDFAKVDRSTIGLSTTAELQEGSDIEQLRYGVEPYDFASFEENAYITSSPKVLADTNDKFGFLTEGVGSGANTNAQTIEIDLGGSYTVPGITIGSKNQLGFRLSYLGETGAGLNSQYFYSEKGKNLQFYNLASNRVRKIKIIISNVYPINHFLGIYRIDFGSLRIFDETNLIDAEVNSYFSKDGSTIEYDVLKLDVFHEDDTQYLFTKKQPIIYKKSTGETINKFFVEKGEQDTKNTISLTAYDSIALLEGKFLGGIYGFKDVYDRPLYPYNQLIADILEGTGVEYRTEETDDISVYGYIPICSKRKALALLCKGTNTRCYKDGGVLVFKPWYSEGGSVASRRFGEDTIVEGNSIKHNQGVGKLTVSEHRYKKSNEVVDVFNWYLKQGENTGQIIEFSEPIWQAIPYEVIGTDEETDEDILDTQASRNVFFAHSPQDTEEDGTICNHLIIEKCTTSNKVVIKGWKILENTSDKVEISKLPLDVNAEYDEVTEDEITIVSAYINSYGNVTTYIEDIANALFSVYAQPSELSCEVVNQSDLKSGEVVEVDASVATMGENINSTTGVTVTDLNVTSVTDDLSGIYKVVVK